MEHEQSQKEYEVSETDRELICSLVLDLQGMWYLSRNSTTELHLGVL